MTCHCSTPAASASLNMARLKKATPHAFAVLTLATINTLSTVEVLPSQSPHRPQNVREMLEGPIYTPALWCMGVCCELLHSGNV